MLEITNLFCPLDHPQSRLDELIVRKLKISPSQLIRWTIVRKSLDARRQPHFVYAVQVQVQDQRRVLARRIPGVRAIEPPSVYQLPRPARLPDTRPIVVGAGPCGLFAALALAEVGLCPIVLERGAPVEQRIEQVERYWQSGIPDPESNVQFGEGGAGTFSDGKLTTRVRDPRIHKVNQELIEAGAPEEIATLAHPHIGTDQLRSIVRRLREKIIALGGEVHFHTRMDHLLLDQGRICGVSTSRGEWTGKAVVLALGHSARDTFEALLQQNVFLEAKDFAVGVRVEHLQQHINQAQYGSFAGDPRLKPAEYRLTFQSANGRGVYTFCMCPGGQVVASASDRESIVTNGMSVYARDGLNANSAVLVQVRRSDFGNGPLDGIRYQKNLEHQAWILGGRKGFAPCQRVDDYLRGMPSTSWGEVVPSYRPGVTMTDLNPLFEAAINDSLKQALQDFDRRIPGFASSQALMTAVDTRSSCPLRITRDPQTLQSLSTAGLYPAGEGAGYAGGIMSAAIDGLRVGEQLIRDLGIKEEDDEQGL